jgi:N-acetylglutamate synthase-like GNAT family acetyltransferase
VRVAGPEDAAAVTRVLEGCYPELLAPAYDPELLARVLPQMTRANPLLLASGTFFVCEAGGEAVGCGGWTRERPPGGAAAEPGLAHLRHFAVRSDWVGRGVGRALYRRCEASARAAGMRRFEAWSTLNGEGFYRALGFARVEAIAAPMGPGLALPSMLMRRNI